MELAAEFQLDLVRTESALSGLEAEWKELHAAANARNPFLGWEWTQACLHELGTGATPFVLTLRMDGRLVGLAPLRLERNWGFRVLRFIGDGRSDYLGFLLHPEAPDAQSRLLEGLEQHRAHWDLAVLRQLNNEYSGLASATPPKLLRCARAEGTLAPYVACRGDWETLCATGPGWLKRMSKALRKFEREGGRVERHTGIEALAHIDELVAIEARSWKGEAGVGRFQPGCGRAFLERVLRDLAPRGEIEVWIARVDEHPVAFALSLLTGERILLYQGAYDQAYRKQGPGAVLEYVSIRRAWEAGVREYDYMSGNEPYKAERTNATRVIRYLALHTTGARGLLAYSLLIAPRWHLKDIKPVRAAHQWWVRTRVTLPLSPAPLRNRS